MNYTPVIAMLVHVLVSCMSTHNHLLYFARFCAESMPKIANKNIQQNFAKFPNHFLQLTIARSEVAREIGSS